MSNEIYLTDEDVMSMPVDLSFAKTPTSKVNELKEAFIRACLGQYAPWITEGVSCNVLLANGDGWQKGKARFRIEFVPDNPITAKPADPNSPLADLRSDLEI